MLKQIIKHYAIIAVVYIVESVDIDLKDHWGYDVLNDLERLVATSNERPKGVLANGLQNLNQQEIRDVNQYPTISHRRLISSDSAMNVGYNCYNYAPISTSNLGYLGDSSFNDYSQNVASTNISYDGMSFISPLGRKPASKEFITSPDHASYITACSYEDAISDTEAFDSVLRHSISGTPSSEKFYQQKSFHQGMYSISSKCFFPSISFTHLLFVYLTLRFFPFIICYQIGQYRSSIIGERQIAYNVYNPTSLVGDVQSFFSNPYSVQQKFQYDPEPDHLLLRKSNAQRLDCGTFLQSQVPFQKDIHAPESAHFLPTSKSNAQRSDFGTFLQSQAPFQKDIFAAESAHFLPTSKSKAQRSDFGTFLQSQVPFQKDILAAECGDNLCKCDDLYCNICGPARRSRVTADFCSESRKRKYDTLDPPIKESRISTGTLADMLPPNYLNGGSAVVDQSSQEFSLSPSQQQGGLFVQLPCLEQWGKAGVHDEDISEEVKKTQVLTASWSQKSNSIVTEDSMRNNNQRTDLNVACCQQKSKGPEGNSNATNNEYKEQAEISSKRVRLCVEEKSTSDEKANFDSTSASDVYDSVLESAETNIQITSTEKEESSQVGPKANFDSTSASDVHDSVLESVETKIQITSTEKEESSQVGPKANFDSTSASDVHDSVLESVETKIQITSPDENELGLGSKENKTPSTSMADSFTTSQIKEHLLSFPQHKEISGNMTPSISHNICQLCSMEELLLSPAPIYCSSCDSRIKRNVGYYRSANEEGPQHCICVQCFVGSRGANIVIRDGSVPKAALQKAKNDEGSVDSWVQCDRCQYWQHRICGLYNNEKHTEAEEEYICPKCCLEEIEDGRRVPLTHTAVFGAKDLPRTNLSDHIEQRLFTRMKQERVEMAKISGIELEKVPVAEDLVVRVVVSVDKQLEVKQQFRDILHGEDYPAQFSYKSKRLGGVDVCLFGMCVQEFGSDCGGPNNRCVYISYLDSVKYFKPERNTASGESLRTFVYHEILVGYLEYCKKRGFATCYIWACPLIKGEDYIFYCHPETQRTPKQDKLRQWYKSMLRKAAEDDVVVETTNLYNQFFVPTRQGSTKITAARLPYFDGDYWSTTAESIIKKLEEEESSGGLRSRVPTKRTLMAMGVENPDFVTKDVLVMQRLGETILPSKENFIIARLQHMCTHCHEVILSGSRWFCNQCNKIQLCSRCFNDGKLLSGNRRHTCHSSKNSQLLEDVLSNVPLDTKDGDDALVNSFFETRDDFLNKCQKSQYQFDTLGHAKYSSMMILYHFMHKLKLTQSSTKAISETKSEQLHKQRVTTLKDGLDALSHASKCKSIKCSNPDCGIIRKLLHHASICSVRVRNGCKICERAWWILKEHAQICEESNCRIPRC
ncbi:hypothetical protein OSB04_000156, partial [Centaurea solstitialis]